MSQQPSMPVSQQPQAVPEAARARLEGSAADGFFTSDLSVNEFVLTTQTGFEPLGLVMGTSVYHVGIQPTRWGVSQELPVLTQAMYTARELAMARMTAEAAALGADGVIGVRIRPVRLAFSAEVLEFMAVGTAIKAGDGASHRTPSGAPFTSHLSGQDFWTLWQHGWLPRAMVMGTCVYHVAHLTFRQSLQTFGVNAEMKSYTQAIYDARELAMSRMQYEGRQVGAGGVVGVSVEESTWAWGEHAIEFFALGTAVSRSHPDRTPVNPAMVMPLTN
ncbi:heavy metal-binding domain-containing protein [Actinospica durhamensis]|uniref:Heavy metal-binding domain-containing protein n=1 Tax=Actinospica durhamensis TaxID=1508375 RepID=A0A941EIZ0_9ACTN|nr:heavy metal-binding domain-containing protein [Actinospica durhamensis]MBR7832086.1 heavy metal-binding domain-containing protein [Actinospica durhamensis]